DANSAVFSGGSAHTSNTLSLRPSGASPKRRRRSAARPTVRPDPVAERLCRSLQAGGGPTMTTESIAPTLDLCGNVAQFFRAVLNDAIEEHGVQADDATETYLVALLADYTRPDQLSGETLSRPLTLLLDEALQAAGYDRFERLRSLGDGVLYVSGFFGDHLKYRVVALYYVSSLGVRGYVDAAQILRDGTR